MHFKLVIVQASECELRRSAELFEAFGCDVVALGHTGEDALRLGRLFKPDALIMDAFLPGLNCDEVAEQLEQTVTQPMVKIAISNQRNDRLAEAFMNNGGDQFLLAPLDYSYTIRRIERYYTVRNHRAARYTTATRERYCARKYQLRMKMPIAINGFVYIQDAVEIAHGRPQALQHVTRELYPAIGALHRVPPGCVERCIRTAIEQTFERGDMDFLYPHFGHAIRANTGKPTNSEFIAILTEMVREDLAFSV